MRFIKNFLSRFISVRPFSKTTYFTRDMKLAERRYLCPKCDSYGSISILNYNLEEKEYTCPKCDYIYKLK